jgi:hypothetical protein
VQHPPSRENQADGYEKDGIETIDFEGKGQSEEGDARVQASRIAVGQKREEGYKSETGDRDRVERSAQGGSEHSEEGGGKEAKQLDQKADRAENLKGEPLVGE